MSCQRISQTVVTDIYHEIDVLSADGFVDDSFGFPRAKAGYFRVDQVSVPFITVVNNVVLISVSFVSAPFNNIIVYFAAHLFAAVKSDDPQSSYRYVFKNTVIAA